MPDFTVRFRGYSRREVDDLEARVERSLAGSGELTADGLRAEIDGGLFEIVLRGYDPAQVNTAVQDWVDRLSRLR
ncbi:hypothetical protein OIE66_28915 [Nonomuraea sp. NBC_01738]|uniref:hypothetical protein n=1 Tax=Nonomuraea sp. NBC_01738 TaxID=2976003 RepID=UPI002E165E18|nr:hypothetical protein OIE66_28915 [Nonomuraea sp. NBC_01738]